ncbi:hypothetical protein FE257_007034 [Aspergillus nanangensis]|uniref:Uncharacterized protein n=1 Tax=Aspergillus nanangensis TaxID=2582783 RepID=A0AAD4CQ34_ASPNN|nr:hypothetical protein FE257_007034 [Aspergillus nanangensis]
MFETTGQVTPTTLNIDRCVSLHNAIIRASSSPPNQSPLPTAKYFDHHATIDSLTPQLTNFLSQCDILLSETQHLSPFVVSLAPPSEIHPNGESIFPGYNNCVNLYLSNNVENDSVGLVFDMTTNKATWVDFMYDCPPDYTEHVWVPLDEVLEAWLRYIRRGRCIPRGNEEFAPTGGTMEGWSMVYPPMEDVEETLATWEEYVSLVEARMPSPPPGVVQREQPEQPPQDNRTPFKGFAEAFFTRARTPTFTHVAPSLVFPSPSQMEALAARQQERFHAEESSWTTEEDGLIKVVPTVLFPLGGNIHAGLATTADRGWQDGVGLVLPTAERYESWAGPVDEENNDPPAYERVWQVEAVQSPFWPVHAARMTWVLRRWIQLVEEGVWRVGTDGVQGSWEEFVQEEECVGEDGMPATRLVGMLLDGVDAC